MGLDNRHVEAAHRLAVEMAASLEHHEDLGVIVTVLGRLEPRGELHHLGVEPAVALDEQLPARAATPGLGRLAGVRPGRDGHVPVGVVETVDAPRCHESSRRSEETTSSPRRTICSRAASGVTPATWMRTFTASAPARCAASASPAATSRDDMDVTSCSPSQCACTASGA